MASMYSALPFLPGNQTDRNIHKNRYHKSQLLTFNNEVANIDQSKPGIGGLPAGSSDLRSTSYPAERGQAAQPAWLAFDRQVLRFYGHFQETVQETNGENYRVRYCTILFYLEDDTIQVNEKVTDNSGLNQGTLIRRHRIPKPAPRDDQFFSVDDLNVGAEVTLYGRVFALSSCDDFTADFLGKLGIRVGGAGYGGVPPDMHTLKLEKDAATKQPLRPYEKIDTLKQFLEHDRQVLRFYCLWDDTRSMFGDKRYMVLHYFLADDTIEVREVLPQNAGRDGTGMFFRRARLPKSVEALAKLPGATTPRTVLNVFSKGITDMKSRNILDSLRTGAEKDEFYMDGDLQIGTSVTLLNRNLLLCDCDDFTKSHYNEKFGVTDFAPVNVEEAESEQIGKVIPPPTGYGTNDDSMVSVNKLVLMPPKKFPGAFLPKQHQDTDGSNVLRWYARLESNDPLKVDRRFILSYYLVDDTISIYEQHQRNSGMRGGKFLERGKYMTPSGSRNWDAHDLFKGAVLEFQSHPFVLIYADEYSYTFMEANRFPYSDAQAIMQRLNSSADPDVKASLKSKRPREDGSLESAKLRDALLSSPGLVNQQEAEAVVRAYLISDGRVDYKSFSDAL